ncbi:MAG: hypothetical protein ACE147_13225 [Candidatus Methylomirabilales bacterium]
MNGWVALGAGFRCGRCGEVRGRWARALRSPFRRQLAICQDCLETWQRTGQRCARCWAPIREPAEVGLLVETGALAHVDCGGALVLGSPISGGLGRSGAPRRLPRGAWLRLFQSS